MKIIFCFILVLLSITSNYAQNISELDYNLPPNVVLPKKGVEQIDLSFKLNSVDYQKNELADNFLRKFSAEEIQQMELEKGKDYYYYNSANKYFMSLSEKVRRIYSYEELWYIYMFDQSLKMKLTALK